MPEYGFSLAGTLSYKDRIYGSVLIRENTAQRKPVIWNILHNEREKQEFESCTWKFLKLVHAET